VGAVDGETLSDADAEVCVVEWVEAPKGKLVSCSFLKPR
jgi:hypothetical protein